MSFFQIALALHALAVVLGLGQVAALVTLSATSDARVLALMLKLMWTATWSLLAVFVTGILIIASLHGGDTDQWWFRISFLLMIAVGALLGMTRGAVKKAAGVASDALFAKVRRNSWVLSVLIAIIVVLMSAKPF